MKTKHLTGPEVTRNWHLIDAKGEILGRIATRISTILMGKNKATYSPHMDAGDYVVVINAGGVELTGLKKLQKVYRRHSGYPGGLTTVKYEAQMIKDPRRIIEHAVSGMLPDNRLKSKRMRRLKVFKGKDHDFNDKFVDKK